MKRRLLTAVSLTALLTAMVACSGHETRRGRGDAPIGGVNGKPADIVEFPDQFANIAMKCLDVNGIYVTTREAAPVVVVNDPLCQEERLFNQG